MTYASQGTALVVLTFASFPGDNSGGARRHQKRTRQKEPMQKISMTYWLASKVPLPFFLVMSLLLPTSSIWATTAIEQTFADLVHRADVIAVGTVTGIGEEWNTAQQAPFTLVTLSQLTVVKGTVAGNSITLHFLGGHTPDGMLLTIPGVPRFTMGDKVVVFCAGNRRDFCPLVGIWQGLLRVAFDSQRGVETVHDDSHRPIARIEDGHFVKALSDGASAVTETLSLISLLDLIDHELRSPYAHP
jgi:hypothetical protein